MINNFNRAWKTHCYVKYQKTSITMTQNDQRFNWGSCIISKSKQVGNFESVKCCYNTIIFYLKSLFKTLPSNLPRL